MDKIFRTFIFSDGHGNLKNFEKLKTEMNKSDLILFAGDFTKYNSKKTGLPFVNAIAELTKPTFSVMGNCDHPEIFEATKQKNLSVDATVKKFDELYIAGSGGGSKFTGTSPYERSDEELVSDLAPAEKKLKAGEIKNDSLIVITHNPPFETKLDRTLIANVGSKLIRAFIEKWQPLLHISGHIHESFAIDKLGKTVLVNPGTLADGRYALCEIIKKDKTFSIGEIKLMKI